MMEYKLVQKTNQGTNIIRDAVTLKDNVLRHMQIELRNGLVYMRMKSRKIKG